MSTMYQKTQIAVYIYIYIYIHQYIILVLRRHRDRVIHMCTFFEEGMVQINIALIHLPLVAETFCQHVIHCFLIQQTNAQTNNIDHGGMKSSKHSRSVVYTQRKTSFIDSYRPFKTKITYDNLYVYLDCLPRTLFRT